jgi:hypothetical protein
VWLSVVSWIVDQFFSSLLGATEAKLNPYLRKVMSHWSRRLLVMFAHHSFLITVFEFPFDFSRNAGHERVWRNVFSDY